MKSFIVIFESLEKGEEGEKLFSKYVIENNFEWWRYATHSWVIVTPDHIQAKDIMKKADEFYGSNFVVVFEAHIIDAAGTYKTKLKYNPFIWFDTVLDENYVHKWEKGHKEFLESNKHIVETNTPTNKKRKK